MKKILLLFFTSFISSINSFGQAPGNDLLANATLINSFPFTDSDVRLDLATASSISPADCGLGEFNLVYYKFTATNSVNTRLTVNIEDSSGGTITGGSFAIIFTAPSLNITDETELIGLAPGSSCAYSSSTSINLSQGTHYYILVNRGDPDAFTDVSFEINELLPVPDSERNALVALYNSSNGDTWTNNSKWNSNEPVGNWYGVTTSIIENVSHVTSINLGSNNLTGTLPPEIGNFPNLTYLGLWANQITGEVPPEIGNLSSLTELDLSPNTFTGSIPEEIGDLTNLKILWLNQNGLTGTIPASIKNLINLKKLYLIGAVGTESEWTSSSYSGDFPDLTALPLEVLEMQNNFFHFNDIADEFATYQANIPTFIFEPQYTLDPPEEVTSEVGEDIVLTLTDVPELAKNNSKSMNGNNYQWIKDGSPIAENANSDTYVILNAQNSDSGVYSCEITNDDVPGFIVTRVGITVSIGTLSVDSHEVKAFQIFPNPVQNELTLKTPTTGPSQVTLFDINGRIIQKKDVKETISQIDTSYLAPGIYLLKWTGKNESIIKHIIKK